MISVPSCSHLLPLVLFSNFSADCDFTVPARVSLRHEDASIFDLLLSLLTRIWASLARAHFLVLVPMHIHLDRRALATDQGAAATTMVLPPEYSELLVTQDACIGLFIGDPFCLQVIFFWWSVGSCTIRIILGYNREVLSHLRCSLLFYYDISQIFHRVRTRKSYNFVWKLILRNVVHASIIGLVMIIIRVDLSHLDRIWIFLQDELSVGILVDRSMSRGGSILIIL